MCIRDRYTYRLWTETGGTQAIFSNVLLSESASLPLWTLECCRWLGATLFWGVITYFSIFFSPCFNSANPYLACSSSFRVLLYNFPKYLIGFSVIEVTGTPSINGVLLLTLPSMMTRLLLFYGLIESPAHLSFPTSLSSKYFVCSKFSVLVTMSSMNKLALSLIHISEPTRPY